MVLQNNFNARNVLVLNIAVLMPLKIFLKRFDILLSSSPGSKKLFDCVPAEYLQYKLAMWQPRGGMQGGEGDQQACSHMHSLSWDYSLYAPCTKLYLFTICTCVVILLDMKLGILAMVRLNRMFRVYQVVSFEYSCLYMCKNHYLAFI